MARLWLRPEWVRTIRQWATRTPAVDAVVLFGSRAKGCACEWSDADLGILLTPPPSKYHNWLWHYTEHNRAWKAALEAAMEWPVDIAQLEPGHAKCDEILSYAIPLWRRRA